MSTNQTDQVFHIPVHLIQPNPSQPRKYFDEGMMHELAESIRHYGILQPISIRMNMPNFYELVAGERRLRAAKMIGMETVPSLIINITERDSAVLALVENLQRENLNYLEEAKGYANLIDDFDLKQQELADQLGRARSTITNKLRLLQLPLDIQNLLLDNHLSERHARALLKLNDHAQLVVVVQSVIDNGLNVKETEKMIQRLLTNDDSKVNEEREKSYAKDHLKNIRLFANSIKEAVDMVQSSGLEVDYKIKQTDISYEINISIPMDRGH